MPSYKVTYTTRDEAGHATIIQANSAQVAQRFAEHVENVVPESIKVVPYEGMKRVHLCRLPPMLPTTTKLIP